MIERRPFVARLAVVLVLHAGLLQGCITYRPTPLDELPLHEHARTEELDGVRVTTAALGREEAQALFPVRLARHGIQPVWLEIENEDERRYLFFQQSLDPNYWAPAEAAYRSHYSGSKRFLTYGLLGIVLWPLLVIAPVQWVSARIANNAMDEHFVSKGIGNGMIDPGESRSGIVFTHIDEGTKEVNVELLSPGANKRFSLFVEVPGLRRDYERIDFRSLYASQEISDLSWEALHDRLEALPCCVTNRKGDKNGDPANLVIVGEGAALLEGLTRAGWDETEVIDIGTSWKTAKSFLFSSEYRYSPVSNLYMFGRPQDAAFQKARDTIHERNHMRLWLAPFTFEGKLVWVGQVSRDIGVKFTTRAWNLTTHAIDGDVDDARENVLGDLLQTGRMAKMGYVPGVGKTDPDDLPENLTGDRWWSDGMRAVTVLERQEVAETLQFSWEEDAIVRAPPLSIGLPPPQ